MTRTKWLRLGVKDPADILRWAGAQNTARLDDFRHRVIRGREFVSFRMVPRYRVQIGTHDIVVMAYVQATIRQRLVAGLAWLERKTSQRIAALKPSVAAAPPASAQVYSLATPRLSSPSSR